MGEDTAFVGLDVHKETIAVAVAEDRRGGEVRYLGEIENTREAIRKLVKKLGKAHGTLHFCYEAGPCGYGIHRLLTEMGHDCELVAPSKTPARPGDRVKTDRRDAVLLARLHRAGELTPVWVPDEGHEAMRDLVRARTAAMEGLRRARQQLSGFLLRHDRVFRMGCNWTKKHRVWLSSLRFQHPAHQIVLQEYIHAVDDAAARLARIEDQIRAPLPIWSLAPVVEAIQAMRGVSFISAVTVMAETGDLGRFDNPRQLMSWLGLVPSEYSSGPRTARGGITKAGSKDARRMLIEGAWTYRCHAAVGKVHMARLEGLPQEIRDIAWKAQIRLCARYRRLSARGPSPRPSSSLPSPGNWPPSSGPSPGRSPRTPAPHLRLLAEKRRHPNPPDIPGARHWGQSHPGIHEVPLWPTVRFEPSTPAGRQSASPRRINGHAVPNPRIRV